MAKVLVIDDEADFREVVRFILEFEGHEVLEAKDGEAGIDVFRKSNPDLVITDIFMPGKDGLETIMELRALSPYVKIIAMSATGTVRDDLYLNFARKFGARAVIEKPFMASELLALVYVELDSRKGGADETGSASKETLSPRKMS